MATKHANLASALVAFQSDVPTIAKNATADTGKYSYSYAPLEELVPLLLPLLAEHGLAYSAVPDMHEGVFVLRASLLHESGEVREGNYPLVDPKSSPQSIGSAITYARRYALTALTGVAPGGEDDDGAKAETAVKTEAAAPKGDTPETLSPREEITEMIHASVITPDEANEHMKSVSKGKTEGWTAAEYKKGLAAIKKALGTD